MSDLKETILRNYESVKAAGAHPFTALEEATEEILGLATVENVSPIIDDTYAYLIDQQVREHYHMRPEGYQAVELGVPITGMLRTRWCPPERTKGDSTAPWGTFAEAIGASIPKLSDRLVRPLQGYFGGLVISNFFGPTPFIFSAYVEEFGNDFVLNPNDPVQNALGKESFVGAYVWLKALRAEAYINRPKVMRALTISEWLAENGLTQGSAVSRVFERPRRYETYGPLDRGGHLIGATGFMPGEKLNRVVGQSPDLKEHRELEAIPAFRLSGMADQIVADADFARDYKTAARSVIAHGGSLN